MRWVMRQVALGLALLTLAASPPPPIGVLPPYRIALPGGATLPVYASADPAHPPAGVRRLIIIQHGLDRHGDAYFAAGLQARAAAGAAGADSLVIGPQVLSEEDAAANHVPDSDLRFGWNRWAEGEPAKGPAALGLFDAYDALLGVLADRARLPDLRLVVFAGHSAGGQIVQRYAVVGNGPDALARAGIATRFIVANPSSYIWFSAERPAPNPTCAGFADWRYGLTGRLPAYVTGTPAALEARYVGRDVTYLLGTRDINPNHPQLDKSCAGETQGPTRYARGHAYFAALQARAGAALRHRLFDVPGVAHSGARMLTSGCAMAVMFDTATCPGLAPR